MRSFVTVLSVVCLWGCGLPYTRLDAEQKEVVEDMEVELPAGWNKHEILWDISPGSRDILAQLNDRRDLTGDKIRITRDGLLLQYIAIGRVEITKEFPHTRKKLSAGMLPQEVAGIIADNLLSNPNITRQKITANVPALVGDQPGFKLAYSFETNKGLPVKGNYYGALVGEWHYYLIYEAPAQYYFEKDYPVFEKLEESFRIRQSESSENGPVSFFNTK